MQVNAKLPEIMLENTLECIKCERYGLFNHPREMSDRSLNNTDETADRTLGLVNNLQATTGGNVEQSGKNVQRFRGFFRFVASVLPSHIRCINSGL